MKNKKTLSAKLYSNFNSKRFIISLIWFVSVILIIFVLLKKFETEHNSKFNEDLRNYNVKLQILNQDKKAISEFFVAIADNLEKKINGLMNLDHLPSNYAMLLVFEDEQIINMWMKNTKISLDMLFIDKDNKIVKIAHKTTPYSLEIISSEQEVTKVLEINGGLSKQLGIEVGQKIKLPKIGKISLF